MDDLQRHASQSQAEATLVLAGPGSGKTTMLAGRVRWLVDTGVQPARILCLTFSRKAAVSMRGKIDLPGVTVSTFHSFCLALLRERPDLFGVCGGEIADDAGRTASLAELLGDAAHDRLEEIDIARERGEHGELASAYERSLVAAGKVDFAGMALRIVRQAKDDPGFAAWLGGRFSEVLVDEYQDVSPVQETLVRILFEQGARVWAVGDDDQSLYEFRAADVRRIIDFASVFAGASIVSATANYRSSGAIVEAARRLIGHNRARVGKATVAKAGVDGFVVVRGYQDDRAEAAAIGRAVRRLMAGGAPAGEIAILARNNGLVKFLAREVPNVSVMTCHASKGLEWDFVFVAGCEDGVMPAAGAPEEEERRVFYVAATRARIGVSFSYATERFGRQTYRSSFLDELGVREHLGETPTLDDRLMVALARRLPKWLDPGGERRLGDVERETRNVMRGRPERSGTKWTSEDDIGLEDLVERRVAPSDMARLLKRTVQETVSRVEARGLVSASDVGRALFERSRARAT